MSKYIESYGKQAFAVKQRHPTRVALHSFELLKMDYYSPLLCLSVLAVIKSTIISLANKKIKDGSTVPVKLQPEPDNQFDWKAIVIMTTVEDKWERIGYVVKEALDDVHEAINNNKILSVFFAWIKYIVYFKCPGMQGSKSQGMVNGQIMYSEVVQTLTCRCY